MLKLSIITINYNNADGLRKTIESVIKQTSRDFEYIVIDGGSTDSSIDIIKEYEGKITYWVSEPDRGIYDAMNKGILAAKGEYCQFLNSGDYLIKNDVTEQMIKNMPDCSILYGNMLKLMKDDKVLYNKKIETNSFFTFYNGSLNHPSTYIKRSLFKKYGYYDENLKIVSDWKFYLMTIGLYNELVAYRDIDVCFFDMDGVSSINLKLAKEERAKVLKESLPPLILADYEMYCRDIIKMKRINRYKLARNFVWLLERILFKIDKYNTKRKRKHIY